MVENFNTNKEALNNLPNIKFENTSDEIISTNNSVTVTQDIKLKIWKCIIIQTCIINQNLGKSIFLNS